MLAHGEAEGLANHIVEGHGEEVASQQEQAQTKHAIELAPLSLLFEHLVHLNSLASLPDLDREGLLLTLNVQLAFDFFIVDPLHAFQLQVIYPLHASLLCILLKRS